MIAVVTMLGFLTLLGGGLSATAQNTFAHEHFERTWARTDKPVAAGQIQRTWMWGPWVPLTPGIMEDYAESPNEQRLVQYFDKSRMELTCPVEDPACPDDIDPTSPWYVTNGLLVVEMVEGAIQLGDATFDHSPEPAQVNVAGDPADPTGPTYATIGLVRNAPALADGALVTQRLDRGGNVTDDPALAAAGVTAAHHVQVPGIDHQVASPFWDFMNATGIVYEDEQYLTDRLFQDPFYATGLPISEAYWANVVVAGQARDVLLQCFERRCLTYTLDNDPTWQVEMGNVGRHYYSWRYEQQPGEVPSVGETLFATTLEDWANEQHPWDGGGLEVGLEDSRHARMWTTDMDAADGYGDASISLEVRLLAQWSSEDVSEACVLARVNPDIIENPLEPDLPSQGYWLCLTIMPEDGIEGAPMTGAVRAYYYAPTFDGDNFGGVIHNLLGTGFADPVFPDDTIDVRQWHRLTIVAQGTSLWFLLDGTVVGSAVHTATTHGEVGFDVGNYSGNPVTWQLRNLEVRALE